MTVYRTTFFCAGEPRGGGTSGGKVMALPIKTRINEAELGPEHWDQRPKDFDKLVNLSRVKDARTMVRLKSCIFREISDVFHPAIILPLEASVRIIDSYPAVNPLVETAIEQQKLIYLPDIRNGRAVTVEDSPKDKDLIYSVTVGQVGGNMEALKGTSLSSLAMAPMLARDLDGGGNSCYGVLVLLHRSPDLLHKMAGVIPLRRYSEKLGRAAQRIRER
jgi:hypothetical protein